MAYRNDCDSEVLCSFASGAANEIRVTKLSKDGELVALDLRNYFLADDGEFRPTQKGVRIKAENIDEFIEVVKNLKG